ncbi:hypothetical protein JRQ81_003861 [Phrynocephalus forsythii]|uniref:Death domain-containing protein n=1 Tax=Phrynocephalus forsythii TaxID=171643 RepID=A0A9Q1AXU7_9SAUR|nr:hypothetical protein JRQ81_003861 [Phrynocephalus forsythii]
MDVRGRVLRTLEELREGEILTFCYFLNDTIPRGKLEGASSVKLADLLFRYCPDTVLEVTAEILEKIPRRDLLPGLRGAREGAGGLGRRATLRMEEAPAAAPGPNFEAPPRQVSDQELMKVANHMGKRWKQIGIQYLGIKKSHLEQIEEENPGNVPMRAFYTLVGWRNHEKEKATASQLYHILNQDGVELDQEAYGFLLNST